MGGRGGHAKTGFTWNLKTKSDFDRQRGMTEHEALNKHPENKWENPPCANLASFPTFDTWNR